MQKLHISSQTYRGHLYFAAFKCIVRSGMNNNEKGLLFEGSNLSWKR